MAEEEHTEIPHTQGRILNVIDSVWPFFQRLTVKDASSNESLYKCRIHSRKPHLRLSANGDEIALASYAGDTLETCTTVYMKGQTFEMRWDREGPAKPEPSQYWSSPTFAGTQLVWHFTDTRTDTACIEGDTSKPVAILRWKIAVSDVAEIEILDGWPAGDIDEIVMLALVSFYRRRMQLYTGFS